ncbi:MAG: hypothetical protein JO362_12910 [Streptomycetaceae bacterium]|nr:hypothetical protein [Streptomycetaceae bacterium]
MAKSHKPVTPTWSALINPDRETFKRLCAATLASTRLVQCGAGRDAVVIPLQRGLAALDVLKLSVKHGYSVLADYTRHELIVIVEGGLAHLWGDVEGVRVLSLEVWLLVPVRGADGSLAAAWLSRPRWDVRDDRHGEPALTGVSVGIEACQLYDALTVVDKPLVSLAVAS